MIAEADDDSQPQGRRWKLLQKHVGGKWPIFTGDFDCLNELLSKKSSRSVWIILQYLNSLFRSFGQVILANNPVSGAFIMLAIGIASYRALLAAIYASSLSFIFAHVVRQDKSAILNGAYGFNPVLHGTVSIAVLPTLYPELADFPPKFWLFLGVTCIISVYVTSALNSMFRHLGQYPVPCFSLPFNLVEFLLIYCLLNNTVPTHIISHHLLTAPASLNTSINNDQQVSTSAYEASSNPTVSAAVANITAQANCTACEAHLNWGETFSGTILAVSQVYGLNNVPCALIMYLALFIYSPIMTAFAYLGSLIGTIVGLLFAESVLEVYAGAWGYNGLLCSAALGGFCFALNGQSTLIAIASIIFANVLQHVLNPIFLQMNLPILTMPFNITTMLFLYITTEKEEHLSRPAVLTSPERHQEQYANMRMSDQPMQGYLRKSQVYEGKDDV